MDSNSNKIPLNQILYGPPGTGKTYSVIDEALKILKEYESSLEIPENREQKKKIFDEHKGQIEFITFHQSYSYEEFVEGIKPNTNNDNSDNLNFEIQDGIFKQICNKAQEKNSVNDLNRCIEKLQEEASSKTIKINERDSITYKGGTAFRLSFPEMSEKHEYYSAYIKDIKEYYKNNSIKTHNLSYVKKILKYLKENYALKDYKESNENEPYILIIDEINRGNISKILGELITLIEPSKRLGEKEAIEVKLPYSNDEFGVPNNLYIIGTMNTADRSIALMDTALRRRFSFVEMMPNYKELEKIQVSDANIQLNKLLEAINTRIEYLLDREHTIGHAFFFENAKKDEISQDKERYITTLDNLKIIFKNKIIPLLQEYFYDDYEKIKAVLNDDENKFIKVVKCEENPYIKTMKDFIDDDKILYKIADSKDWEIENFTKIYDDKVNLQNQVNNEES